MKNDSDFEAEAEQRLSAVLSESIRARRKSPGRPTQIPGLIKTPIFLTAQQRDWLARQGDSMAAVVRQLIDEAMKRHP